MHPQLNALAEISRRYGADPQYTFGGGGNTSWKNDQFLYIKPSGVSLATIQPAEFVKMGRGAIRELFAWQPPSDPGAREAEVKSMMQRAVCADSRGRPSVEAPVHEIIPYAFVVHTHSVLANGLTCAKDGAAHCARLFPEVLWVPYVDPGYTLSVTLKQAIADYTRHHGAAPKVLLLQSHGIFVAADTPAEVDAIYDRLLSTLRAEYAKAGITTTLTVPAAGPAAIQLAPALRSWLAGPKGRAFVHVNGDFQIATGPLTPDHVVYGRAFPFVGQPDAASLMAFQERFGYAPIILQVPGQGVFTAELSLKSARLAMESARNAALVQQMTGAFGGPRYLDDRQRGFIENWEVESYRRNLIGGDKAGGRLQNRVALITGGAQGFGLGIAKGLLAEGATVALADINLAGASAAAQELERQYGAGRAFALAGNVGNEASVAEMTANLVRECGGLDLLVANAGVLRAGSVKTLTQADWDLVTQVNYTGYFLCVKHLAPVMAAQRTSPDQEWCDIVQINSKSGLVGSNKNAAYAGGKFGGIGLTQSFALELVSDGIKVNAICPGNFFDGPLWSDPERGLFVQYLRSGKVPGASTVAEVKKFYEDKVPMGRGCQPEDVVKAILYCVDQKYETGQAIAVTGGQVMLG